MRPDATSALLAWFEARRDRYPWRRTVDPYAILLSEVMLQQTQAARAAASFAAFLERFPTVGSLAAASRADVLRAWDGLGYNRRAVALSEAARAIVRNHGGAVPREVASLRTLPGMGPYTAAAVAALAFGERVVAVDTNVRRVVARVRAGREPHELSWSEARRLGAGWLGRTDPSAWHQALMDLGREHCRPRPRCEGCPLTRACRARRGGRVVGAAEQRGSVPAFAGSTRQARGAIVRALRRRSPRSLRSLLRETGLDAARATASLVGLHADGVVHASAAALRGSARGLIRLGD